MASLPDPIPAPPPNERPSFARESRETMVLALPLIAGQVGQMLIGLVDTVMVGRLGVVPLGAAAFASSLVSVPLLLGIGMLSAVSVRVSQARGAGFPEFAKEAVRHGSFLAVAFWIVVMALVGLAIPFLRIFGQPADVTAATPGFLILLTVSLLPAFLSIAWKNHGDALNRPWLSFWILTGGVGLNIILNWLLIYGKMGFPAMGLVGSGWATLIARLVVAIAMLFALRRALPGWWPERWRVPLKMPMLRSLLVIGIPASLQLLTEVTAFAAASLLIGTMGAIPLAAHQIAISCAATAFMVPLGLSMAMTVRVGQIVGTEDRKRLRAVMLGGWIFSIGFVCVPMALFLLRGVPVASYFVSDPQVIQLAARLLIVAGLFQLFDGLQVVSAGALRGINDVRVPALIALTAYWGVALPFGAMLAFPGKHGAEGIWIGLAAGLALAAGALVWRSWQRVK